MIKVVLTGAGGSIGYETLKQLILKDDLEITAVDLPTTKNKRRLKKYEDKANIVYGSINDEKLMEDLLWNADVIIHLAAIIPPLADSKPDLTRKVNFFGTKTIVDIIKERNKNCFLIFSSSISVYGDRVDDPWITVNDPLCPSEGDYYAYVKIETEKMIQESKINYTIFRLTGIMGHPMLDPLMFHMPLNTKMEIASTIDTARAFVNAVYNEKKLNKKIFNLGGGENCRTTYREFLINMFKIYGINIKYLKELAFAEKNFHCGYYKDTKILNDILDFQRDTLDSYYKRVKSETKGLIRFLSKIFSRPIVYFLELKSEPMEAKKKNNKNLINRFFKK